VDVREGGAPKSQGVSGVRTRVTLLEPSQGLGESFARVLSCAYVRVSLLVFFVSSRMVPACSFYSLKEVQGYKMLVRGRSLLRK
jgi:hypothetical protein